MIIQTIQVKRDHNTDSPVFQQDSCVQTSNSPNIRVCSKCNFCMIIDEQLHEIGHHITKGEQNVSDMESLNASKIEDNNLKTDKEDEKLLEKTERTSLVSNKNVSNRDTINVIILKTSEIEINTLKTDKEDEILLDKTEQNILIKNENVSDWDTTNIISPKTSEFEVNNLKTDKHLQELLLSEESLKEEFTQMSGSGCTLESAPCEPAARARYYHNKLLATLQILENKEETVRVQKESLEMAEQRIVSLTSRVIKLKQELDRRGLELQSLKKPLNKHNEKANISGTTNEKEVEKLKKVITTLQYNLSVIEELYRECFYETAKQEELVETLRKSYLDVRLTEKEKSKEIGNLQNVTNTQKWSLEKCQDIAIDVDHLKVEISNFLNNSNNDSGMWERSEEMLPTSVTEDLRDIAEQLEHLKLLLKEDCLCGFEQENKRLKEVNDNMNSQLSVMRRRICELEAIVSENEQKEQSYQEKINVKQQQLNEIQQDLANLRSARDQCSECETLVQQLQEYKSLLSERDRELKAVQAQCDVHEANINELKEKLNKTNLSSEKCTMRQEIAALSRQVASWHAQLRSTDLLQKELVDCRKQSDYLLNCYSEKSRTCDALEQALSEAEARGAKLCSDSRRALEALRSWVVKLRNQRKEQDKKISEQTTLICELRGRLREICGEHSNDEPTWYRPSETESCHAVRASGTRRCRAQCASGTGSCNAARATEADASCSTSKQTPIPPRRTLRKKPKPLTCEDDGSLSPSEEVLERVERLHDALRARWPRWARPHHQHPQ